MNDHFARARAYIIILLSWFPCGTMRAQTTVTAPTTLEGWADRLTRFGNAIPQEKVFVHLDNTCYFLGDTIWYAAYTRRTDKDLPSNVSRVLYVELLNQDGFLVERQLVEMKGGRGHGNFVLLDTLYAGYYELRAYTRWQLNWGVTEKEHSIGAEDWFYNAAMAKEYYRDYDKLYSRVFPVYDKPLEPGDFYRDMTTRPLRRYFKSGAPEPQPVLSLFPEGGHVVAGLPCRVAFEAATESGEALEGRILAPPALSRQIPAEGVATVNRGRGVFTFTPEAGQNYEFTFTDKDGRAASAKLPAVEADGVALSVEHESPDPSRNGGDIWRFDIAAAGEAATKPLGLTVMHEGVVQRFEKVEKSEWKIGCSDLPVGVNQVTVFDADGRIYADRLFFITSPSLATPSLAIDGLKEEYAPFEQVALSVRCPAISSLGASPQLSLSIRDAGTQDYTYDNGNILTEMLLSSELKGFIPNPAYFFEADDEEHRQALDLLMMTQGWRRFDWHTMATPEAFALTQPAETQTPIIRGEVLNYSASWWQDDIRGIGEHPTPFQMEEHIKRLTPSTEAKTPEAAYRASLRTADEGLSTEDEYTGLGQAEVFESIIAQTYAHENHYPTGSYRMLGTVATSRFAEKEKDLKNEVLVHAEFAQPPSESVLGEMMTQKGNFTIQAPRFEGYCIFFLAASDTTKWKADKRHTWISMDEKEEPEFYVHIRQHYPRFTLPYDHYQTSQMPIHPKAGSGHSRFDASSFETDMSAVTVRARRGGLRHIDLSKPAYVIDAYAAFNDACDAGLMEGRYIGRFHYINSLARLYAGDMDTRNTYLLEPRYDGRNRSYNWTAAQIDRYNLLQNLDSVRLYTDYNPRTGGDPRAKEDNVERLSVSLQQMADEGQRVTYRDRRYVLQGFNVAEDFYHPDYSQHPLPDGQQDYRRTLYWNPDLQLDADGKAQITFFTGSKPTTLSIEANGQATDGTLLTN